MSPIVRLSISANPETAVDPRAPAGATGVDDTTGRTLHRLATAWLSSRAGAFVAIAIVVLATFLRLWQLDLVEFKDDQAALLRLAEDMGRLGRVPLAGMTSSIGVPLPGTFEYVLAPVVALSRDPRVATAAIGLANVAAVGGTMLWGWRRFSPLAGLVAGLAFAANPWAVFFSRKVWSNDVLAPVAVLLLFCLDNAVIGGQAAWAVTAFPVFALGVAFHPSFALLAPLLLALAVFMVRRRQLKHLAVGLGLAAITGVPYLVYNLHTEWSYLRVLGSSFGLSTRIDREGPGEVIGLLGGWENWYVEGLHIEYLLPGRVASTPGRIETVLLAIGVAAALTLVFGRSVEQRARVRAAGLLLWVVAPMLLTIRHTIPLYEYYFLFVLPAGTLLIGLGIQTLAELSLPRRAGRLLAGLALAATVGVASIQSVMVLRQLRYLTDTYVPYYGLPLFAAEQLTGELIALVRHSGGQQLSVEVDDVTNDVSVGYLARPYVPEVQVVERSRGPWDIDFSLPDQGGSPPYALSDTPLLTAPRPLDVAYADGVRVVSESTLRAVTPGQSAGLAITWTVEYPTTEPLTNRLLWQMALYDASGREVGRQAGLPHDWSQLSAGDVVVSWITVPTSRDAAEGVYEVRLGRLDPVTRKAVADSEAETEWSAGTVDVGRS